MVISWDDPSPFQKKSQLEKFRPRCIHPLEKIKCNVNSPGCVEKGCRKQYHSSCNSKIDSQTPKKNWRIDTKKIMDLGKCITFQKCFFWVAMSNFTWGNLLQIASPTFWGPSQPTTPTTSRNLHPQCVWHRQISCTSTHSHWDKTKLGDRRPVCRPQKVRVLKPQRRRRRGKFLEI